MKNKFTKGANRYYIQYTAQTGKKIDTYTRVEELAILYKASNNQKPGKKYQQVSQIKRNVSQNKFGSAIEEVMHRKRDNGDYY